MTDLAKLVVRLEAQTAQYMKQLDTANKRLDKFTKSSDISAKNIAKGVAAAATAAATAFGAMAKSAIDSADDISKMSQTTGLTTENLSQLKYAADLSGTSFEDLTKSIVKFQRGQAEAADGIATYADAFKKIDVAVKNSDGTLRETNEVLLDVADRFSKLEDGAAKAALAQELFGKAGAQLIPFLNMGRKGIAELTAEAEAFGLTISEKAGREAELFNDNLSRIGAATRGLVNQLIEKALPTLVAISEAFVRAAKNGDGLASAIGVLSVAFKSLVTAGVIVKSVLQTLGRLIYGVGEALVRVAQGEFKMAASALSDAFNESKMNVVDDMEFIGKVWGELAVTASEAASDADDAIKDSILFNSDKAKEEAQKAADAALKALQSMSDGLRHQANMFGMTEQAAIRYRVAQGDIAELLTTAGEKGRQYAESIVQQTDRLEALRAAQEASEKAQEEMNAAVEEGRAVAASVITPMEAYTAALENLQRLHSMGAISTVTYDRAAAKAKKELEDATKVVNKFAEEANRNIQDILGDGIYDALTGSMEGGIEGMLKSFEMMLHKMVAQAIAADIGAKLFGAEGSGSGGGWIGKGIEFLSSRFGGSRDSGGRGSPGMAYAIGAGAQPELFVPDSPGRFYPRDQWMGGNKSLTQNIYVQGRVDERTASQLARESDRRQRVASRLGV